MLTHGIPSSCPYPQMSSKPYPQGSLLLSHSHNASFLADPYEISSHLDITRRIRLQPHALAFVRVGLFPVTGGTAVASSGAFTDARSGAATAQVVLRAGKYIIEPEVNGPSADGTFSLMVYYKSAGISLAPL
jgi:hypothetical protein